MDKVTYEGRTYFCQYLGDAVYALSDGNGIWLHVGSHDDPTDRVFLEPEVLGALIRFMGGFDRGGL